ncbi:MAG TPA: AarF/UbiB family protein [Gemmatimonadaceae bacterium]|jgi:predicted unusual protein kinase regulating ubiquinone biosynthesis (AarF/ABC1/UbiB family)|nr:AarF/UbiB family protein [Gemmatimonadaceae bacterium]
MGRARFRLIRIYGTTTRVLASYLWLRARRPFVDPARYAELLEAKHRANARRIRDAIIRAGGLFIKVGQLISVLANVLPADFRAELEGLQDRLPPRPFDEISARIRAELGGEPDAVFASFDREPLATASLAQVHEARMADGRRVAVKVQHADIDRIAKEDLETIRRILAIVQFFTRLRGMESYHPEISQMIGEELDFRREAENVARIAGSFAGNRLVRMPAVVPERSTSRVLTTEFVDGAKVIDFDAIQSLGLDRQTVAERVVSAYCRMIFVDGVYHADPHPGNLFVAPDGAIVFVDFGAVGELSDTMRLGVRQFFEGVIRRDASEITNAVTTMGFIARNPGSIDVAQRVIDYFQRTVFEQLTTESWGLGQLQLDMRAKLDQMADLRRLDVSFRKLAATFQVPKNWVLLERTLLLLIGLCIELAPSWNPMTVIRPYLEGVVAGPDRSWTDLIVTAIKEMAKSAAVLPEDVRQTLGRANRGELEIRVPEINAAARLVYAGARQLIFAVIGTASGVLSYQAYDRGQRLIALPLLVIAIVFLGGLTWSMLVVSRRR